MSRIWLTSNLLFPSVPVPRDSSALWVFPDDNKAAPCERSVSVKAFMENPRQHLNGVTSMVLVGLVTRITTPSNRVKTGQWFTDPLPGVQRYSIDSNLFITDPWRLWWHFGCVGKWFKGCSTSYTLEGRWKHSLEGKGENPITKQTIREEGKGVVVALNDAFKFESVKVGIVQMEQDIHEKYAVEKAAAFNEERTLSAIVSRLQKFARASLPSWSVPSYGGLFKSSTVAITATDLGVDNFVISALKERIELTNFIAEEFRHERL